MVRTPVTSLCSNMFERPEQYSWPLHTISARQGKGEPAMSAILRSDVPRRRHC